MTDYEKALLAKINLATGNQLIDFTPSLVMNVFLGGKKKAELRLGDHKKYYDLASLTKPIFTTSTYMRFVDEDRLTLDSSVRQFLEWWPHRATRIRDLLTHTSGLPWWAPFHQLYGKSSPMVFREKLREYFETVKLGPRGKAVYSDLDMILLGFVDEAVEEHSLLEVWENTSEKWDLEGFHFNPGNKPIYPRSEYAPTEKCPWRKKVLQGEVHDDNTWAMGGVSSHAGLFGRLEDVTGWGLLLRKAWMGKGSELATHETAKSFCKRAIPKKVGDWAMGFTMPSAVGSTAGHHFSPLSVGHTGFTGTSIWLDPKRDLLVTILANRVHPTRDNQKFKTLRPLLHDFVVELL